MFTVSFSITCQKQQNLPAQASPVGAEPYRASVFLMLSSRYVGAPPRELQPKAMVTMCFYFSRKKLMQKPLCIMCIACCGFCIAELVVRPFSQERFRKNIPEASMALIIFPFLKYTGQSTLLFVST